MICWDITRRMNMTLVYILKCAEGKYYVGKTNDNAIDRRIKAHMSGLVQWTKLYPPTEIACVLENADEFDEDKYAKIYMKKYGVENVRGGSYSQIKIPRNKLKVLYSELKTADNLCYKCGETGHYIKKCPSKKSVTCYRCQTKGHYANKCNVKI